MAGITIVFDFDHTIIDVDSDNWVVDELGATDLFNHLLPTMPWNDLMDRMMRELHAKGKSVEDVKEALKRVPIHPAMLRTIKKAHALGCDLRIVSDANVLFIETIVEHLGIKDCFSELITNPSYIDQHGSLRVSPFIDSQSSPHGCALCPPNMCKGMIIERMKAKEGKQRIIYLGDGKGDFCPSLKLKEGDFMMPRENYPVWKLICENRSLLRAELHEWSNGQDVENILFKLIEKIKIQDLLPAADYMIEAVPIALPQTVSVHQ